MELKVNRLPLDWICFDKPANIGHQLLEIGAPVEIPVAGLEGPETFENVRRMRGRNSGELVQHEAKEV